MADILIRCFIFLCCCIPCVAGEPATGGDRPLTAVEARKKVGETVTVQMRVRAAKDRLEKRGEIYLDAEPDFRSEKNFAVVITKTGARTLKEAGIRHPAEHFRDKTIQASGKVTLVQDVPRIEIESADQIRIVDSTQPPGTAPADEPDHK